MLPMDPIARRILASVLTLAAVSCTDGPTASPPAPAFELEVTSGDLQQGRTSRALDRDVVLRVTGEGGRPEAGVGVRGSVAMGHGRLDVGFRATGVDGTVHFRWTMPDEPGDVVATFGIDGYDEATPLTVRASSVEPVLVLERVEGLVEGETATLHGERLDRLSALVVDGVAVPYTLVSTREATFPVPTMGSCEVDGRPVRIQAAGEDLLWPLTVDDALTLEVGESRLLGEAERTCVPLARGDEAWLVTLVNTDQAVVGGSPVLLRTEVASGGPVSTARAGQAVTFPEPPRAADDPDWSAALAAGARSPAHYGVAPEPFDPTIGDAGVGDRVEMVAWDEGVSCVEDPTAVPTFSAEVVAVAGSHVILVDTRIPELSEWTGAAGRETARRAAELVDAWALPASRAVYGEGVPLPQGAGGRTLTLVTDLPDSYAGLSYTIEAYPESFCPLGSEMLVGRVHERSFERSPESLASLAIHELAHGFSFVSWIAFRYPEPESWAPAWVEEAFAVNVEETAARLAQGELEGADPAASGSMGIPFPMGDPGEPAIASPFGAGRYTVGAQLVLYARERAGQSSPGYPGPSVFDRMADADFAVSSLASEADLPLEDLLEGSALAGLVTGVVPPVAADAHGLPRFASWRGHDGLDALVELAGPHRRIHRDSPAELIPQVGGGAYVWWVVPADAERGVTLRAETRADAVPHRLRITRLR